MSRALLALLALTGVLALAALLLPDGLARQVLTALAAMAGFTFALGAFIVFAERVAPLPDSESEPSEPPAPAQHPRPQPPRRAA